jgi:hypothetical protein
VRSLARNASFVKGGGGLVIAELGGDHGIVGECNSGFQGLGIRTWRMIV